MQIVILSLDLQVFYFFRMSNFALSGSGAAKNLYYFQILKIKILSSVLPPYIDAELKNQDSR